MLDDLFFPRRCPVCDRAVRPNGRKICIGCQNRFRYVQEPRCLKCSKPLEDGSKPYCYDCESKKHYYDEGIALYEYASAWDSIFKFKYQGRQEYADYYGEDFATHYAGEIRSWNADALIPVPLYKTKEKKRGFNQSEKIANAVGKELNISVNTSMVKRVRNTVPQKELDDIARQNNLKSAFQVVENDVKLNTIIIVDDIYTTGSTIDAISTVLRSNGVQKIFFLTLAVGRGF